MTDSRKPVVTVLTAPGEPAPPGIEAVKALNANNSQVKSIILSMHDSEEYILQSVSAGAKGYLLKDTDKTEFIKAIHTITLIHSFLYLI